MPIPTDPLHAARRRFTTSAIDRAAAATLDGVRRRLAAGARHPDARLLEACLSAADLWRDSSALFYGPTRIDNDDQRDVVLRPIWAAADVALRLVSDHKATTLLAHRARAAVLLEWDAGALIGNQDSIERRLILALAADLIRAA